MKRISILLLILVMLLETFSFVAVAADKTVKISAADFTSFSKGTKYTDQIQLNAGGFTTYSLKFNGMVANAIQLQFRTGKSNAGVVEIRVGSADGELLGSADTSTTGPLDWTTIINLDIYLSRPLEENEILYLVNKTGVHTYHNLVFNLKDPNTLARNIASLENIDAYEDIANDINRTEINLMAQLGVFDFESMKFLPNTPVSRIEVMKMLGKLIDSAMYASDEMPFDDVSMEDENAALLSGLYNLGIIRGGTDGRIRPDEFITIEQLVYLSANALGFSAIPAKYADIFTLVSNRRIFDGIDTKDKFINRSEAAKFIYNLFTAKYLTESVIENGIIKYDERENFLEKSTKYYYGKGLVTGNYDTMLFKPRNNANNVLIDGEIFYSKDVNAADYIGVLCEYFYCENDGEKNIVAIYPSKKADIVIYKSSPDTHFEKITEKKISVTLGDEDPEEYELNSTTAIIYNGIALDTTLTSLVNSDNFTGTITLIDNNNDDIMDCVWIDHARTVVVDAAGMGIIYDSVLDSKIDCNNSTLTLVADGTNKEMSYLKKDDVITVYQSVNATGKKLIRILADRNIISGKITEISNGYVTINDERYKIAAECISDLEVGLEGDFRLNAYDMIVSYSEVTARDMLLGLFLEYDYKQAGLYEKGKIKLLTENEGIVIYDVSDRVVIDGVLIKDPAVAYNGNEVFVGMKNVQTKTPILYRLNEASELVVADTQEAGSGSYNDSLRKLDDSQDWVKFGQVLADRSYIYKHPCSSSVKTITLNGDADEENYSIVSDFNTGDSFVEGTPYTFGSDSFLVNVVVSRDYSSGGETNEPPFVFTELREGLDSKGDKCLYIHGYNQNGDVKYLIDTSIYKNDFKRLVDSLKNGDIVQAELLNSKVRRLQLIFIPGGTATNSQGINTLVNSQTQVSPDKSMIYGGAVYGTVVGVEEDFIRIDCGDAGTSRTYRLQGNVVVCNKQSANKYNIKTNLGLTNVFVGDTILAYISYRTLGAVYVYRNLNTN